MQTGFAGQSLLLIGYGYVAKALHRQLSGSAIGVQWTVRHVEDQSEHALLFGSADMMKAAQSADYILTSVPPGKSGPDPALEAIKSLNLSARWIGYLSATSVYGDRGGRWAFEGEAPTPSLARGRRRADAEIAWLESFAQTHIFRLAGIYGPERSPFAKLKAGDARIVEKPGHVVNRIHVDDIASALLASMARPGAHEIFNIADGQPAPPGDVLNYSAALIGADKPPHVPLNDDSVSAMARSFYAETKRIDIGRARQRLNWQPHYPDYQSGLQATLSAELEQ